MIEKRQCKYLNNIVEPDHRMIKWRIVQGLIFKEFEYNKENACWNRNNKNVKEKPIV